jgi:CheY-like chemotaxis protein
MSTKLKFTWIDDNPERASDASNMKKRLNVSMAFKNAKAVDLNTLLNQIIKGIKPDLIIVDHNLDQIKSGLFKKGSTVAAYLREKWVDVPVICITAVPLNEVDNNQKSLYDEIFEAINIARHYKTIISIAKSFKKFRENKPNTVDDLLSYLQSSDFDKKRLSSVVPKEVKANLEDPALVLEFARWVRKALMDRPGLLYDRLSVATLLGIKIEAFKKIEGIFKAARYKGIFADESKERWWKSEVLSILNARVKGNELSWEKGRKLPKINRRNFSTSHVSGEFFPETVAYVEDNENSNRFPMKLRETIHHPAYDDLLFFDEIRLMKPNEN